MIKLTISPDIEPNIWTFDKSTITIGSSIDSNDIFLPNAELQDTHVKIVKEGDRIVAINAANDPFATLNDLPFGKKSVKSGDILQLGHYNILIEIPTNARAPEQASIIESTKEKEDFQSNQAFHEQSSLKNTQQIEETLNELIQGRPTDEFIKDAFIQESFEKKAEQNDSLDYTLISPPSESVYPPLMEHSKEIEEHLSSETPLQDIRYDPIEKKEFPVENFATEYQQISDDKIQKEEAFHEDIERYSLKTDASKDSFNNKLNESEPTSDEGLSPNDEDNKQDFKPIIDSSNQNETIEALPKQEEILENRILEDEIQDDQLEFSPIKEEFYKEKKHSNHFSIIDEEQDNEDDTPPLKKQRSLSFEVGEFDDESENWINEKNDKIYPPEQESERSSFFSWKIISGIILALILISGLVSGALYFNKSAKNEDEEIRAAEGVADIAMALKYAQIQHIKPHKKNWSDPEFIKNTLALVIPHDYPSLANIDSNGHINHTSYSLRIYTSTDFSRFLVIAQPAPSLLQSFIPKTAIVIDSKLMQLRKVVDMKTLNRLLANSNNLDNSNAFEVTNLVKNGELIPLYHLAQKRRGNDFSPPRALALIRPGAENYIYNAPRYYQLSETIMKKALGLVEQSSNPYELSRLKQEISLLAKMQDLVLYSVDGMEAALQMQKAVAAFASNNRFLTAFLKINTQGLITASHLLIVDENEKSSIIPPSSTSIPIPTSVPNQINDKEEVVIAEREPIFTKAPSLENIHPFAESLRNLKETREKSLTPLKNEITALLEEDISHPVENLEARISILLNAFFTLDSEQKQAMASSILKLSKEYNTIAVDEYIEHVKTAQLEDSYTDIIKTQIADENLEDQLEFHINQIRSSNNFSKISYFLNEALTRTTTNQVADLTILKEFQNVLKNEALNKVNSILFSSNPLPLELTYEETEKTALQQILQKSWLKTPEEQSYYLQEFENIYTTTQE